MNWTRESPTKKGWYWLRQDKEETHLFIVYVIDAERMVAAGSETEINPAQEVGEWYGPLEPPPTEERGSQP